MSLSLTFMSLSFNLVNFLQMLTMSTLGGAEENYTATFDDHTSVNLKVG